MPEQINYAESYQGALQEQFINGLTSTRLWNSPSNGKIKWVGHKTVKLPRLNITAGRQDRTRRTITTPGVNYSNEWDTYELENERYWSTLVDPSDVDETDYVTSIANITATYNKFEKVPEMDKQMYSSLFARKVEIDGEEGILRQDLTEQNILATFDDLMTEMTESEVPLEGRVLYVTPTVRKVLKNADDMQRLINVQQNNGQINRNVHSLDDVELIEVPSSRFKTAFDFTVGAKDIASAEQIQMMLILPEVMCAPQKYSFVGLDAPTASTSGNYLYYEQAYDDVLLFKTRTKGLRFVLAGQTA